MSLFLYNLARCGKDIIIHNRSIVAPVFGSVDYSERFDPVDTVKAIIKTSRGKTLFDGVSVDRVITHEFCLAYIAGVSAESWIEYDSRLFDILDVENCGENNTCLKLRCNERGTGEAAQA
jgi:head-tail adaptor